MPRVRKNTVSKNLTKAEREEFEAVGYNEKQIDDFDQLLRAERWDFWSKASELFLTLAAGSNIVFTSGKARTEDTTTSAKFYANLFSTPNRETARLIFLSDVYADEKVKLMTQHTEDVAQAAYSEFKTTVFSSKENVARLKKDIEALESVAV